MAKHMIGTGHWNVLENDLWGYISAFQTSTNSKKEELKTA